MTTNEPNILQLTSTSPVYQPYCISCHSSINENDNSCESCGYPLKGTDHEQRSFINHRDYLQLELQDMNHKIQSATQTLYVLSIVCAIYAVVIVASSGNTPDALLNPARYFGMAAAYFCLALWSRVQPLAAVVTALVLYVSLQLFTLLQNPLDVVQGLLFKILVVVYLLKGAMSAAEAQKIRRDMIRHS